MYASWGSNELQYYWRGENLNVIPQDQQWRKAAFAQAVNLARAGDNRAQLFLSRLIEREPGAENAWVLLRHSRWQKVPEEKRVMLR